jgi:hypothetical protein
MVLVATPPGNCATVAEDLEWGLMVSGGPPHPVLPLIAEFEL